MFSTILSLLLSLVVFFFGFVGVGHALVRWTKLSLTGLENLVLSTFVGISLGVSLIVFSGYSIGTTAYVLWWSLAFIVGIWEGRLLIRTLRKTLSNLPRHPGLVTLSVIGILLFASTLGLSRQNMDGSIQLQDVHDSMWHVALVEEATQTLPPHNPAFSEIPLTNYHYFYDVFLASLKFATNVPILPLYFQFSLILLAGLLVLSAGILGRRIGGNFGAAWLVFLSIFCGNFAYFIPWFIPGQAWHESSFWVSQTFGMLVNPQVIYTLALTYIVMWLLQPAKQSWRANSIVILLIATSLGFKSYAWVVLAMVYAAKLFLLLWQERKLQTIGTGLGFIGFSLPFLWLTTGFQTGNTFFWSPFWFLSSMVEAPDRLNLVRWKLLEDYYRSEGVWYRVLEIQVKEFLIFYAGNLGVRVLGVLATPWLLWKTWRGKTQPDFGFIVLSLWGFLISTTIPLLLLQHAGGVWNSIQFWYYGLIFANILTTLLLVQLRKTITLRVLQWTIWTTIVVLAIPAFLLTIQQRWKTSFKISPEQSAALISLKRSDRVLICPSSDEVFRTLLVEAISPASVYFSNPQQLELFGLNGPEPEVIQKVFQAPYDSNTQDFLSQQHITHFLCNEAGLISTLQDNGVPGKQIGTWWFGQRPHQEQKP